jgi:exonuclease III
MEEFIGISDRIAILRAQLNTATVMIIQVYAPTEQSSEEEVENFYVDLDEALTKCRAQKIFVMGDLKADNISKELYKNALQSKKQGENKSDVKELYDHLQQSILQSAEEATIKRPRIKTGTYYRKAR